MNYDVMAADLFDFIAESGLRDVRLIGHSMGGKTILRFAQQYSFLIDRMVVADMGMKAYPPHHDEVFKGLFAVDVENCPSRKEAEERLKAFVSDQGTLQFLLKNLFWREPGLLDWRFNLPAIYNEREHLMAALPQERVETSTLFLTGGKSHYVLPKDVDAIKQLVPQVTFDVMAGAGHWLHAEDPAQFIERTLAYLS
jgi:pimeloyl-ACP methyl ester carboxylesterase